ncbi:MAG: PAS domain S-box protein [Legionella sp.]|nr:MAG: PAS domain S-box protein [Legionella sp.]
MKHKIAQVNWPIILPILTMFVGILVLIGWAYDIEFFKSVIPNETTMKANTAVGMILCSLAVICLAIGSRSKLFKLAIIVQSLIVIALAVLTLLAYLLQIDLGFHQLLFKDMENTLNPGRMSPTTAFCFLNMGIALLLALPGKGIYLKKPISAALCTTVMIIAGLVFFSYIPVVLFDFHVLNYANMGIHTALLFLLLSLSVLIILKKESDFHWTLNRSITGGCILLLMALIVISLTFYNFIYQIKKSNAEMITTRKTMKALNGVLISLQYYDMNEANLDNRGQNQKQISKHFDNAYQFIAHNDYKKIKMDKLKSLIAEKMDLADKTNRDKEAAINNQIRENLNQLQSEEAKIFSIQELKHDILLNQALLLSPLGIFLSISMLSIGLFLLNSNLIERKKIKANQKQLADIVASSDDGILSTDLNSIVTSWNAGAAEIFGYTANEMIGQSILTLIPTDRVTEETEIIKKISQGQKIEHFETLRKRKDGKPIEVSMTVSPIKDADNKIIGASNIVRDVTEKKHLELQLRQSQKLSAIGQLTGGISHDFNNLLGIILGNLDLLERSVANNEEALKRVKNALNAATRGADLTKRLLAFSRRQHLNPTPTVLADSINNVVEMATRVLGSNIKISCHLDTSIPPAMIDATELESALLNLSINARDAMPNGGQLIFSTKLLVLDSNYLAVQSGEIKPGSYACISVTDTGEGIPPENLERVFEPFFTTKERGKGTGMGLSMVYGFIKQSGGIIRIYSEVGHGTTISLYLPFANNGDLKVEKATTPIAQPSKFTGKVLAVDDETDLLEIASIYLKDMGFDVLHATDGKSALATLEREPDIKLLVTDIIMPGGINGIELAKRARLIKQDLVVVYTSGFPAETLSDKSAPIEEVLINKPYNRELFITTVSQAMNKIKIGN